MPAKLLVGDPAPDFEAVAVGPGYLPEGQLVRLADLRGQRAAFVFYPSNDPLGAQAHFAALRDAWDDLHGRAVVFGVYHDTPEGDARIVIQLALPYALLCDEGHRLARAFGFWMGDEGAGVDRGGDSIARAVLLLDADCRVEGVRREDDPALLIGSLRQMLLS